MGDTPSNPAPQTSEQTMAAYQKYLPGLIRSTSALQPEVAGNQLAATQATAGGYNALNLQQAQQYAVPLAQVGQQVTDSNAQAGGNTNLHQIQGSGGQAAQAAADLARQTNPNYYGVQDASSRQATNLVNSINLNGLSAGEQNAVERSLNQSNTATGNLGLDNATNAVSNAMNFGGAFNNKLGIAGQALGAANNTANTAQNTGFSPVNIALGQPNTSTMGNFGTGNFNGSNASTQNASGSNVFGFGSGLMNNQTSSNNAAIGAASSANANQTGLITGLTSAACCFIFMEAYAGVMPFHVRQCRDRYYTVLPQVARGYKRMAKWLVPAMQHSDTVRSLVWHTMVRPLTSYGAFVKRKDIAGRRYKWSRRLWFTVWNYLGK